MTDETCCLVLEYLREIRIRVDQLADVMEAIKREEASTGAHRSTIGQPCAARTTVVSSGKRDMDELRQRIERSERRLELTEPH